MLGTGTRGRDRPQIIGHLMGCPSPARCAPAGQCVVVLDRAGIKRIPPDHQRKAMSAADCVAGVEGLSAAKVWQAFKEGELYLEPPMNASYELISDDPQLGGGVEPPPKGFHTHNCTACEESDHGHGDDAQDGATGQHYMPHSEYMIYRWRHGAHIQDHIRAYVRLDHHYNHYHDEYGFEVGLYLSEGEDEHHQYRNYAAGGDLITPNEDEDDTWLNYRIRVEYEYRYCRWSWWCNAEWEEHVHTTFCLGNSHAYWYSEGCYLDE